MNISTIVSLSRPRFWHYVLGPMLIYCASSGFLDTIYTSWSRGGTDRLFQLIVLLIILGYFTLPANLWIYGRNDIADGDTDKFNNKKGSYEEKIDDSITTKNKLKWNIWGWNIGYILIGGFIAFNLEMVADCFPWHANGYICSQLTQHPIQTIFFSFPFWIPVGTIVGILIPFLITSYLYSCRPLRAKSKPFIDGIMNVLYIATPFSILAIQYYLGSYPNHSLTLMTYSFFAALFWCMAMHCYSAIPDIEPDKKAGLVTTAVYLGKQNAIVYCALLYLLSALLSFSSLGWYSIVAGAIYIGIMVVSYFKRDLFALYRLFPYINFIIGFSLFRYIVLYM